MTGYDDIQAILNLSLERRTAKQICQSVSPSERMGAIWEGLTRPSMTLSGTYDIEIVHTTGNIQGNIFV